jgi:hypothetical protein
MDDEVIYIDDDERNAVRARRRRPEFGRRFGGRSVVIPSRRTSFVRHPSSDFAEWFDRRPTQVVVQQPGKTLLGGFAIGELIEMATQAFAALQSLPTPPTAQGSMDIDVENLVTYQTALANHAKRDEQVRTLGSLVGRLLR